MTLRVPSDKRHTEKRTKSAANRKQEIFQLNFCLPRAADWRHILTDDLIVLL